MRLLWRRIRGKSFVFFFVQFCIFHFAFCILHSALCISSPLTLFALRFTPYSLPHSLNSLRSTLFALRTTPNALLFIHFFSSSYPFVILHFSLCISIPSTSCSFHFAFFTLHFAFFIVPPPYCLLLSFPVFRLTSHRNFLYSQYPILLTLKATGW